MMDARTLMMDAAKALLDRHGIPVREFAAAYDVVPARVLALPEAAKLLGVTVAMVRKLIANGQIRETRVGTRVGIRSDILAEYIAVHTTAAEKAETGGAV